MSLGVATEPHLVSEGKVMVHEVDDDFIAICRSIVAEGFDEDQWAERESDDWFQVADYCGGFDADERAFCFSYEPAQGAEVWFQLSLAEVDRVLSGELDSLPARFPT